MIVVAKRASSAFLLVLCRPDIDKILKRLPSKDKRQTVLFSATYPADIKELAAYALRPGYQLVDCVGETEKQTADKVGWPHSRAPPHNVTCMKTIYSSFRDALEYTPNVFNALQMLRCLHSKFTCGSCEYVIACSAHIPADPVKCRSLEFLLG